MAENHHVIPVSNTGKGYFVARPVYQYDYGQVLEFSGFDLPETFEVHFSNPDNGGESFTQIGSNGAVAIPDICLRKSRTVTAWLYLHDTETDGETRFVVEIPVRGRAYPSDGVPDPVEQSAISQAITALNQAVEETATAQEAAETARTGAEAAQATAEAAQAGAVAAKTAAETAQSAAAASQTSAEQAATDAAAAQSAAELARDEAAASSASATQSATDAVSSATAAAGSATAAASSEQDAEHYASNALHFMNNASGYDSSARRSMQSAAASATAAATSETNAAASATAAAGSASDAQSAAQTATQRAGAAINAADEAEASATAAAQSATDAANTVSGAVGTINAARDAAVTAVQDKGDEVLDSIPADYTELTEEVSDLNLALNDIDGLFSDGSTLLSDSLTDKSSTSSGITYTLAGNVVTATGTASGTSVFAVLGSTSSAPPEWMVGGEKYVFTLENNTPIEVWLQAKTTENTSILSFAKFQQSGVYIITIPEDITVFRLLLSAAKNTVADGTITMEISNVLSVADIADDINGIKENYLELATDNCPMVPDNTDLNTYTTPGTYKITNNTHANTMTNIPLKMAGKLVVISLSQTARLYQIYAAIHSICPIYIRFYNGSVWSAWNVISYKSYGYVKYSAGTFDEANVTEALDVYLPATSGYIKYVLYHYVNTATDQNYNVWRIYHVYHVSDLSDSDLLDLTVSGEWECALRLSGRDDFSGGSTHGDEVMTDDVVALRNGNPVSISSLTDLTAFYDFTLVRTSEMYDPADHTTMIANHGVQYKFDLSGLTINQSVIWRVVESLENCFLCMFLPSKDVIDRAVSNSDFKTLILPTNTSETLATIIKSNAKSVTMWDTGSRVSAEISVPVYPTGLSGGDQISISDNNGKNYNKLYFKVCGGGTTANKEMWLSTSVYKIDFY